MSPGATSRRRLVCGNWKMNGGPATAPALAQAIRSGLGTGAPSADDGFSAEIVRQFEKMAAGPQIMILGITAPEMRRFIARVSDPIGAPGRASRRLLFARAIKAMAARMR